MKNRRQHAERVFRFTWFYSTTISFISAFLAVWGVLPKILFFLPFTFFICVLYQCIDAIFLSKTIYMPTNPMHGGYFEGNKAIKNGIFLLLVTTIIMTIILIYFFR